MNNEKSTQRKKRIEGVVVSDKMDKTVVVLTHRFVKHPKYGKFIRVSKKFKAHDEHNVHKVGERVTIEETRPLSKDKTFRVVEQGDATGTNA